MNKGLLYIVTFMVLIINNAAAEQLASVMKGQVVTNNPAGLRVFVTEKDGSILDMVDTTSEGAFKLDLTVMDTPSESEVMKLNLQIRGKSGVQKNIPVAKYLNVFDDTVLLKPITLNQ